MNILDRFFFHSNVWDDSQHKTARLGPWKLHENHFELDNVETLELFFGSSNICSTMTKYDEPVRTYQVCKRYVFVSTS